jgi:hypothetical protein
VVKVRLTGACGGCPMANMTLKGGIEAALKERIPAVERVESVPFLSSVGGRRQALSQDEADDGDVFPVRVSLGRGESGAEKVVPPRGGTLQLRSSRTLPSD